MFAFCFRCRRIRIPYMCVSLFLWQIYRSEYEQTSHTYTHQKRNKILVLFVPNFSFTLLLCSSALFKIRVSKLFFFSFFSWEVFLGSSYPHFNASFVDVMDNDNSLAAEHNRFSTKTRHNNFVSGAYGKQLTFHSRNSITILTFLLICKQ